MKEHDIFLHKLILALGVLWNISCSFAYVLFCCNKGPPHTFDAYRGPYSLWYSFGRVLSEEHTVLFLCLCHVDSKGCHEATMHTCDSTEGGLLET